ncbi:hypothetical protein BGW42_008536 [Actinomortierella wolfii]|nr:hypothetical protein BGW42_008536 [Actinomortierella wolfii]
MNNSDIDESSSTISSPQPSSLPTRAQPANNVAANEQSIMKPASQSTIRPNLRASKERFSKQDIECILTWLEHPPNFASIFGSSSAGKPGVEQPPKSSSTQGYATLAQVVSEQNKGRLKLNAKAMRERFGRFRRTYENVREMSKSKDFGVTDEDHKNGLYTVADKLESMCVCYARMDALFGNRSNIAPSANDTPTIQERDREQEQEQEQEYQRGSAVPRRRRWLLKEDEGGEENQNEGCEDHEGLATAKILEGRGSDGHHGSDDDETNEPTTSTQSAIQQQQHYHQWQKRRRKDMELQLSNKRSRLLEHHQNSPSLRSSSPELPRRSVSSSNGLVARKTAEEF